MIETSCIARSITPNEQEYDSRRFIDRIPYYAKFFLDISLPVEVFPYTEDEIKKMLCKDNHFIKNICKEKIILFERKDTSTL